MDIEVSLSALTPSQYRPFMKLWRPNQKLVKIFQKISGKTGRKAMRLYFDLDNERLLKAFAPECPPKIKSYLEEKGFVLEDYASGIAKDKHNRVMRIGKILSRDPELAQLYESDPERKAIVTLTKGKKIVCLSMHPYDVAGMSTGRGWTSCMDLDKGENRRYVRDDIKQNTLIAYLIDSTDRNITRPLSRVLIKAFHPEDQRKVTFYHVDKVYPTPNDALTDAVQEFVNDKINDQLLTKDQMQGVFTIDPHLYDDGTTQIRPELTQKDADPEVVKNILQTSPSSFLRVLPQSTWDALARRFKQDLYNMAFDQSAGQSGGLSTDPLNKFLTALDNVLDKSAFDRIVLAVCAYILRRSHTPFRPGIVVQNAVEFDSPVVMKLIMKETPDRVVEIARQAALIFPASSVRTGRGAENRIKCSQTVIDWYKNGDIPNNDSGRAFVAAYCGAILDTLRMPKLAVEIKKVADVIGAASVVEHYEYFDRAEMEVRAAVYASDFSQYEESRLGTILLRAANSEKAAFDAYRYEFSKKKGSYMNVTDMTGNPAFWSIFIAELGKNGIEGMQMPYDKIAIYPVKQFTSDELFKEAMNSAVMSATKLFVESL